MHVHTLVLFNCVSFFSGVTSNFHRVLRMRTFWDNLSFYRPGAFPFVKPIASMHSICLHMHVKKIGSLTIVSSDQQLLMYRPACSLVQRIDVLTLLV